jgi:hypothetical protein
MAWFHADRFPGCGQSGSSFSSCFLRPHYPHPREQRLLHRSITLAGHRDAEAHGIESSFVFADWAGTQPASMHTARVWRRVTDRNFARGYYTDRSIRTIRIIAWTESFCALCALCKYSSRPNANAPSPCGDANVASYGTGLSHQQQTKPTQVRDIGSPQGHVVRLGFRRHEAVRRIRTIRIIRSSPPIRRILRVHNDLQNCPRCSDPVRAPFAFALPLCGECSISKGR